MTWDNLTTTDIRYTLYRSATPIQHGFHLSSAQNLGDVRDNSALNRRLTDLSGGTPKYLKIDSASSPLGSNKGLFVATSTAAGSFYYAVTANVGDLEDTTIVTGSNATTSPLTENVVMPQPVWQESRILGGKTYDIYVQYVTRVTSSMYPQMTNAGSFPFHFAIIKSGAVSPHPVTFWLHGDGKSFLYVNHLKGIGDPNEWIVTIDDWIPNQDVSYHLLLWLSRELRHPVRRKSGSGHRGIVQLHVRQSSSHNQLGDKTSPGGQHPHLHDRIFGRERSGVS